jgi:hypothetical protein
MISTPTKPTTMASHRPASTFSASHQAARAATSNGAAMYTEYTEASEALRSA